MRILRSASADEMVATFLKAEISSSRFSSCVIDALNEKGLDRKIIEQPNLDSAEENWIRGEVLAIARGYGKNERIFEKFPSDVQWVWATINRTDLERLRYVDYGYWNRLSGGTRRVLDGAKNVRLGVMPYGVSNQPFFDVASRIGSGDVLVQPILVAEHESGDLTILEGHLRMTSYLLHEHSIPDELEVMIGVSSAMCGWVGTLSPYIPESDRFLAAMSPTAA